MNNISHVVVDNIAFDFRFEEVDDFLTVTIEQIGSDALVFAWTPEAPPRAIKIIRDLNFQVERRAEASLSDFPFIHVVARVRSHPEAFTKLQHTRIIEILTQNTSEPS